MSDTKQWKIVPVKPTWGLDAMSGAGAGALPAVDGVCGFAGSLACHVYTAMLNAAPVSPFIMVSREDALLSMRTLKAMWERLGIGGENSSYEQAFNRIGIDLKQEIGE